MPQVVCILFSALISTMWVTVAMVSILILTQMMKFFGVTFSDIAMVWRDFVYTPIWKAIFACCLLFHLPHFIWLKHFKCSPLFTMATLLLLCTNRSMLTSMCSTQNIQKCIIKFSMNQKTLTNRKICKRKQRQTAQCERARQACELAGAHSVKFILCLVMTVNNFVANEYFT